MIMKGECVNSIFYSQRHFKRKSIYFYRLVKQIATAVNKKIEKMLEDRRRNQKMTFFI